MDVPDQELAFCKQNVDALDSHVFFDLGGSSTEPQRRLGATRTPSQQFEAETPHGQQLCTQRPTHCDSH